MGKFAMGFKTMFRVWSDPWFAYRVKELLTMETPPDQLTAPKPRKPEVTLPKRSEALTLLSVMQREGRLVDFLQEPISDYSDQQVGAAVRDVHKDCGAALRRMFALKPIREESEGTTITVVSDYDAAEYRLVGNVSGSGPFRGELAHPGWTATKVELPEWTGRDESAKVVAPVEVEVK